MKVIVDDAGGKVRLIMGNDMLLMEPQAAKDIAKLIADRAVAVEQAAPDAALAARAVERRPPAGGGGNDSPNGAPP
jgi:hypothetical protein